jgi:hypothetical protein
MHVYYTGTLHLSKHSTQPLSRLMLNETEAWLTGYRLGWQVDFHQHT